ncbi:hypothetical protein [Croceivirga thetidis]|nr:hypothetical protein [Croceivirga thetidis]
MSEKEKEYSGIWMKVGCFLSTLVILAILFIIGYITYSMFNRL